ncbi:uncharacterized protein EV422DRAFT_508453 [Fimicolochytrium jonesii]|uniref:uncharacterized protein n=1 Tax=Fimicolochytrium jonesii TaxID=1396493 RepID=UPI0022FE9013|nr:uncharacterized protein EV422DRAFT_508453 [Fimicolochytrium jonesii]KAI8818269.1 hypothetical protein EV422DRAFT_508453 [Fimicolochytrium jonesii]
MVCHCPVANTGSASFLVPCCAIREWALLGYAYFVGGELRAGNEFGDTCEATSRRSYLSSTISWGPRSKERVAFKWLGEASERSLLAPLLAEYRTTLTSDNGTHALDAVVGIYCTDEAIILAPVATRNPIYASRAELVALPVEVSSMAALHSVLIDTKAGRQGYMRAEEEWDKVLLDLRLARMVGPVADTWKKTVKEHFASYRTLAAFRLLVEADLILDRERSPSGLPTTFKIRRFQSLYINVNRTPWRNLRITVP